MNVMYTSYTSCHSNFSLILSSEYLKRNVIVSVILVEKTGLLKAFILWLPWQHRTS